MYSPKSPHLRSPSNGLNNSMININVPHEEPIIMSSQVYTSLQYDENKKEKAAFPQPANFKCNYLVEYRPPNSI